MAFHLYSASVFRPRKQKRFYLLLCNSRWLRNCFPLIFKS